MAVRGVDLIVHAAALKQVPACEYNPFEAVKTNILGTENVLSAALEHGVERVLTLSTDKAVNPVNLYGATKLCAERITVEANSYAGGRDIRFSCVRYGNVLASRGSVVQAFERQRERGEVAVTDMRMTRFWIGLEQAVAFVASCVESMRGGGVRPEDPEHADRRPRPPRRPRLPDQEIGIRPGRRSTRSSSPATSPATPATWGAASSSSRSSTGGGRRGARGEGAAGRVRVPQRHEPGVAEARGSRPASKAGTRPMTASFIPYGRQQIDDDDVQRGRRALKSDWLTTGPAVDRFERLLAGAVGAAHAVAVSSGTAALHAAAFALGIGPGTR